MHALDTRWFIAPLLGFASENLSFGIGVRGGKTLDNHIYIGGTFVYQTGDSGSYSASVTTPGGVVGASGSWSYNGFYVGPEGGYDFATWSSARTSASASSTSPARPRATA
jgi:hypothetical protein